LNKINDKNDIVSLTLASTVSGMVELYF